jgi:hypothetical protein
MTHATTGSARNQRTGAWHTTSSHPAQRAGYPFDRLASAFDRVRNARDWRAPIEAVIPEEDRPLVEQAITLFTDAPPTFVPAPKRPGHLLVRAQGYGIISAGSCAPASRHSVHAPTGIATRGSLGTTGTSYKGYRIMARPYQVHTSHRWSVDLEIRRHGRCRSFTGVRAAASEVTAHAECVALGRDIIDGKVPGWSVRDLRRLPSRQLFRGFLALLLTFSLSAFAMTRSDAMGMLETVGGWITSLMVLFGIAIVVHTMRENK